MPVIDLPSVGQLVPAVELLVEDLADLAEVLLAVVAGDLEHRLLGLLDDVAGQALVVVDRGLDLVGRR